MWTIEATSKSMWTKILYHRISRSQINNLSQSHRKKSMWLKLRNQSMLKHHRYLIKSQKIKKLMSHSIRTRNQDSNRMKTRPKKRQGKKRIRKTSFLGTTTTLSVY
jgi:hypothetical protein